MSFALTTMSATLVSTAMDTLKMKCPQCGKGVKIPPEHVGRRGRCPHCEQVIVLQPPQADAQPSLPVTQIIVESPPASEALVAALAEHTAALREWSSQVGELRAAVTQQFTDGLAAAQERMTESLAAALANSLATSLAEARASVAESHQKNADEMRALRAEAASDSGELLKQLTGLQTTLVQQWDGIARSFTESAAHAQDQFALMRQGQLESAQDVVSAMAKELQAAQQRMLAESRERTQAMEASLAKALQAAHERLLAESQERLVAQSAALEQLVTQAGAAVAVLADRAAALPEQLSAALETCSADLHGQAESAGAGVAQAFGQQVTAMADLRAALQKDVQAFLGQVQEIRAAQGQALGEGAEAARQSARAIQEQIAAQQQQSAAKLAEIASSIAQRLDASTERLCELQQSFDATASRAMEELQKVRDATDPAADARRERLSAEAQKMLTEVYVRSEHVLRQSWQLGSQAIAQQEAKLNAVSERITASLAQTQQAMARPLASLAELVQKLAPFEKSLTQSWQTLTAADAFRKTLASIDQTLMQLNVTLQNPTSQLAERISAVGPLDLAGNESNS